VRLPAPLYADLVGKPFAGAAHGPHAYGCVGLLAELMRRLGHTLPQYAETEATLLAAISAGGEWARVAVPAAGDAVLLRSSSPPWHVGVLIDQQQMIHAHPHAGVVVERIDGPLYRRRIEGFYRCLHS
jgi:cell wall-associated NlpC family hydrolase